MRNHFGIMDNDSDKEDDCRGRAYQTSSEWLLLFLQLFAINIFLYGNLYSIYTEYQWPMFSGRQ